jgi:hypothetical protein
MPGEVIFGGPLVAEDQGNESERHTHTLPCTCTSNGMNASSPRRYPWPLCGRGARRGRGAYQGLGHPHRHREASLDTASNPRPPMGSARSEQTLLGHPASTLTCSPPSTVTGACGGVLTPTALGSSRAPLSLTTTPWRCTPSAEVPPSPGFLLDLYHRGGPWVGTLAAHMTCACGRHLGLPLPLCLLPARQ